MRYSLVVLAAALATTFGCQREVPQVSSTELTSGEVESPPVTRLSVEESELRDFRDAARRDLMNLDRRIQYLEVRAARGKAPQEARIEITEARRRRDALARQIDELRPESWKTQRDTLDHEWEEISNLADSVGSLLTETAR